MKQSCCKGVFEEYLYALGMRANKTGQVYLDSAELSNCLSTIENADVHSSGCDFDKLMISRVGCSNSSVDEISKRLEGNLINLRENCEFSTVYEEGDQTCASCLKHWKEIKVTQAENGAFTDMDSEICRFTVLVSLTSTRIKDEKWVNEVYNCLGNQLSVEGK